MSRDPHFDPRFDSEISYIGLLDHHGEPYKFTHGKNTVPYYSNSSFESLLKRPNAVRYFTYYLTRYNGINYNIVPMAFVLNFEVFMLFYHYGLVRNLEDFRLDMFVTGQKFIDDPMLYYTLVDLGFPLGEFLYGRIVQRLDYFDKASENYQIVKDIIINYIIEHAGDNVRLVDNYVYQLFDDEHYDIIEELVQKGIKVKSKYRKNPKFDKISVVSKTVDGYASEDRYLNFDILDSEFQTLAKVFCVFDGHGDISKKGMNPKHTVAMIMNNFENLFIRKMEGINLDDTERVSQYIKEVFIEMDYMLYNQSSIAGSTCNLILITPKHIYQVNLGDSRSFVIKNKQIISETVDHDPNLERERIISVGGNVVMYGTYRVNGMLATSRSFGDLILKNIKSEMVNRYSPNGPVSTIPDIIVIPRLDNMEIIMGTDGLFDGFNSSSEKILNEINGLNAKNFTQGKIVDKLIEIARITTDDDITCTSIYL